MDGRVSGMPVQCGDPCELTFVFISQYCESSRRGGLLLRVPGPGRTQRGEQSNTIVPPLASQLLRVSRGNSH